jgi:hypothetical protein
VEDVARTETAPKTAVLPRMVDVIPGIVAAGVVPNPPAVIDVRGVGMPGLVVEVAILGRAAFAMGGSGRSVAHGFWTVRRSTSGRETTVRFLMAPFLGECSATGG